ncbi:MAG: hypothetical protein HZA51_00125 [Planctomycetes bacterium]|nr:hypothetical protein [Planctomycetota bacterium]
MRIHDSHLRAAFPAVLATAFIASIASAESVMLKPKHKVGDTVYVEQAADILQKIHNPMMGEPMEINLQRTYGLIRKVESATDGGAKLSWTYDRAMQKIESPMLEAAYDSDSAGNEDESEMLADLLQAMIGGKFNIEMSKDFSNASCSGMEAILDKTQEAGAGGMLSQQLQRELTDDRGRVTYGETMYLMYPNKEVKVGETWAKTQRDTIPQLGKVVSHYEYKLDKIAEEAGRKVAIVSFKSNVENDKSDKSAKEDDAMHGMTPVIKGLSTGVTTFDIERGMVTKSVSNSETNIEMKQPDAGKKDGEKDDEEEGAGQGPPPGMKIQVKVKQTTTVMSESERAKQKEAAAEKAKTKKKAEPKKDAKKPAKKAEEKEDDDE